MLIPALLTAAFIAPQDVFVSGRMDPTVPYDTFRIPALCRTAKGTLLAFAEARESLSDQSSNVLVLRRKTVNSEFWGPIQVVAREAPHALNNPCVLATAKGRVWMMYQRYPHGLNERTTKPGFALAQACLTYIVFSDDDGRSWTEPLDISRVVKTTGNQSDASGPGVGIEVTRGSQKGRLLFPMNTGTGGAYDAYAVYSDDEGRTWQRGANAPKSPGTQPNEAQVAELADGSILMNARNQASARVRLQCKSKDGGQTWSIAKPQPDLVDPVCMGSLIRLSFAPDCLAFTNPSHASKRQVGMLHLSADGGESWSPHRVVTAGSFAYSSLCTLGNTRLGLLYETVSDLGQGREAYRIVYRELRV